MTGDEAVAESIAYLKEHLEISPMNVGDHMTIEVRGCDDPNTVEHFGRFLVGAIAQAVRTDLHLQRVLVSPGLDGQAELTHDIEKLIGSEQRPLTEHARTHRRDPWIGEALGHLLLVLSKDEPHPCVPAPMVAATLPHVEPLEHGLDLFGFCAPDLSVVIGEAKTSKEHIGGALGAAETLFEDIEDGHRDHGVRQATNALLSSLPDGYRSAVTGAFWKESRCYLPVMCFQSGLDSGDERPVLKKLAASGADCRLILIRHDDHDAFFGKVAVAMQDAVPQISPE